MKKIIPFILAAATLLSAPPARAWIYKDGDVLLVFRKSGQDIEYDIGSVTNFLGKANGYTTTVSNWDPTQLTGAVTTFIGAKAVLLATGPTNYLTSPEPNTAAYNIDAQEADGLHGVINAIGTAPLYPLAIPSNSPMPTSLTSAAISRRRPMTRLSRGGNSTASRNWAATRRSRWNRFCRRRWISGKSNRRRFIPIRRRIN